MVIQIGDKRIPISLKYEVCIPPTLKQIALTGLQYIYLLSGGMITCITCSSFP
jgi:hypothetical protein